MIYNLPYIFLVMLLLAGGWSTSAIAQPQVPTTTTSDDSRFLSILPDLPLMGGLYEIEESGLSFDKPDGRIVIAEAEGDVTADDVIRFYQTTLPQLGWRLKDYSSFIRDEEILVITPVNRDGRLQVKFFVKPQ